MKKNLTLILLLLVSYHSSYSRDYRLSSPDKRNTVVVTVDKEINWSVRRNNEILLNKSKMGMDFGAGMVLGSSAQVIRAVSSTSNGVITAIIPVKNKVISDNYNELKLTFKGGYSIEFRAYNNGVAYRFVTNIASKSVEVQNETVNFNFNSNCTVYLPNEKNTELQSHYEAAFSELKVADISAETYGYLPLYVSTPAGTKMVITESDLKDYPNLFLFGSGANSLKGQFPKVILETKLNKGSDRDESIVKKASYHAKTIGNRSYPWRVLAISQDDRGLLENELVYQLASPNVLKETDWITPGKVAWDWWNANNIYGVNFKSGLNTETYKYYVDFASAYHLEYIILDEGWSRTTTDLLAPNPALDLKELINYAKAKNVAIILWALWKPLDLEMDKVLDQFVKWGVRGVKVDFMARADQYMVKFYERAAAATAKRKLLIDFHGAFKPVGLNREYPNVINYEGVRGMENNKWEDKISPVHDTTIPFTRMVAGPIDFTPGAMLNSNKDEFHVNFNSPMSRGTRAQQASMYVIYDSPLQMLCDNPSNYLKEPQYTRFIAAIPTTWDKTIALKGKIGEYVVMARKKGMKWFVAGMTNWDARNFRLNLDFLEGKKYKVEILKDGINVDKQAADYQINVTQAAKGDELSVTMAAGGGYVAVLTPIE